MTPSPIPFTGLLSSEQGLAEQERKREEQQAPHGSSLLQQLTLHT